MTASSSPYSTAALASRRNGASRHSSPSSPPRAAVANTSAPASRAPSKWWRTTAASSTSTRARRAVARPSSNSASMATRSENNNENSMHDHIHLHDGNSECPPTGGYCRTHELNILLLAALYAVSRVLSRSLAFNETLRDVLRVLHDEAGLTRGLISVVDPETGKLSVRSIYTPEGPISDDTQYGPGEGIIGQILEKPRT